MSVLGIGVDLVEKDESEPGSHEKNSVSYSWTPGFQI